MQLCIVDQNVSVVSKASGEKKIFHADFHAVTLDLDIDRNVLISANFFLFVPDLLFVKL